MARKVGILGASGYGGSELLRILLFHPGVELSWVTADRWAGRRVAEAHPNLKSLTDLEFSRFESADQLDGLDAVFLALPHGASRDVVEKIPAGIKVIDLAGDFRLSDPVLTEQFYGTPVPSRELQKQFVYGLTETNREAIRTADRIANPGCFATAVILGLAPLVACSAIEGKAVADAKTGSSGSGADPKIGTHHPRRVNSFSAYKPFSHQHQPEIVQELTRVQPEWEGRLIFQTHSAPFVRGIFASIYCTLRDGFQPDKIFPDYYADSRFVRLVENPDVNWVKNTNFTDIGWVSKGLETIVFVALDNLIKGAAGQAVQNFNLMFSLPEEAGLIFPGSHP